MYKGFPMNTYINLVVFVATLETCIAFPHVRKPLIIEGFDCVPEDYPFLITIRKTDDKYICGGSLIEENWVLTAGHCCYERNVTDLFVSAALHTKYESMDERARIKRTFIHPEFTRKTLDNDICLMLLETPVYSNRRIGYVKLLYVEPTVELAKTCFKSLILGFGKQSRLSGYGVDLEPDKSFDPKLKCAHLSMITHSDCESIIPVDASHFCAMDFSEKQQDACIGDSGGPFICNGSQIGIVSGGYGCGLPQTPSLFTRLDIFKKFISKTMNNTKNTGCKFGTINVAVLIISISVTALVAPINFFP